VRVRIILPEKLQKKTSGQSVSPTRTRIQRSESRPEAKKRRSLSSPHPNSTGKPAERLLVESEEKARPAHEKSSKAFFHRLRAFYELAAGEGFEQHLAVC